ncbi:MAG: hypothetical protein ACI85U_000999, partial [Candidatus Promineifilaceae bacterium]
MQVAGKRKDAPEGTSLKERKRLTDYFGYLFWWKRTHHSINFN